MLPFSEYLVCVFCLFAPFLSVSFVFHWTNLVLFHLLNRYDFCTWKVESKFFILVNYSFSVIQIAAVSIQQVVLIYIIIGVYQSISPWECCACLRVSIVKNVFSPFLSRLLFHDYWITFYNFTPEDQILTTY